MRDTEMKKPDCDELQLRLQEYTWEAPVNRDRHVEHLAADLPMPDYTDSPPDEGKEYLH
jgi:hypothetical protein